jgi:PheRS DNA binding domain 3/PheRS DNA binding domain 1
MSDPISESASVENVILSHLAQLSIIDDTYAFAESQKVNHLDVVGAVKSLSTDDYVTTEDVATSFYTTTDEAVDIVENGSQEIRVLRAIIDNNNEMTLGQLQEKVGANVAKIGMANCMKNKWIQKRGKDDLQALITSLDDIRDEVQQQLQSLVQGNYSMEAIDEKVRFSRQGCLAKWLY